MDVDGGRRCGRHVCIQDSRQSGYVISPIHMFVRNETPSHAVDAHKETVLTHFDVLRCSLKIAFSNQSVWMNCEYITNNHPLANIHNFCLRFSAETLIMHFALILLLLLHQTRYMKTININITNMTAISDYVCLSFN